MNSHRRKWQLIWILKDKQEFVKGTRLGEGGDGILGGGKSMGKHPENGTIYGLLWRLGNSEQTRWLKIQSQNGSMKRRVIFLLYIYIYNKKITLLFMLPFCDCILSHLVCSLFPKRHSRPYIVPFSGCLPMLFPPPRMPSPPSPNLVPLTNSCLSFNIHINCHFLL